MGRYFWNEDINPKPTPQGLMCDNVERGFRQIEIAVATMDREAESIEKRVKAMREMRRKNALGNHERLTGEEVTIQTEYEDYYIAAEKRLEQLRQTLEMMRRVCTREPQSAFEEARKVVMQTEHAKRMRARFAIVS